MVMSILVFRIISVIWTIHIYIWTPQHNLQTKGVRITKDARYSLFWAGHNGANNFVMACMVVEIFCTIEVPVLQIQCTRNYCFWRQTQVIKCLKVPSSTSGKVHASAHFLAKSTDRGAWSSLNNVLLLRQTMEDSYQGLQEQIQAQLADHTQIMRTITGKMED